MKRRKNMSLMIMFVHYMKSTDWLEKLACNDSSVETQTKTEEVNRRFSHSKNTTDVVFKTSGGWCLTIPTSAHNAV